MCNQLVNVSVTELYSLPLCLLGCNKRYSFVFLFLVNAVVRRRRCNKKKMKRSLAVSILPKLLLLYPRGFSLKNPLKLVSIYYLKKNGRFSSPFLYLLPAVIFLLLLHLLLDFKEPFSSKNRLLYCFFLLLFISPASIAGCYDGGVLQLTTASKRRSRGGWWTQKINYSQHPGGLEGEEERCACQSRRCRQGTWSHFGYNFAFPPLVMSLLYYSCIARACVCV